MTLKDCYEQMGADFEDVLSRLRNEALIRTFVCKFLDDKSIGDLKRAMEAGMTAFVPKPIDLACLYGVLRSV